MEHGFSGAASAGAWQISTPPLLATAPLLGTLRIHAEAGIEALRAKSRVQTAYLIDVLEVSGLTGTPYHYRIGTPREPARRGGHVAVEHDAGARIARALKRRGVIPDFRPPNVVRLAPIPLYTSYHDIWQTVRHLRNIIDTGDYRQGGDERDVVS